MLFYKVSYLYVTN